MDVFSVVTTAVVIDVVIVVVVTAVVIDVVDVVTAVVIDVVVVVITLRRGLGRSQFVYDLLRFQQTFRQRFDELRSVR